MESLLDSLPARPRIPLFLLTADGDGGGGDPAETLERIAPASGAIARERLLTRRAGRIPEGAFAPGAAAAVAAAVAELAGDAPTVGASQF